jgi:mannosyl-glycoprotein endo-beta-N-acetylglucosaminidase
MSRGHVCKPYNSVRDLLEAPQNPMPWWSLVEPLQPRTLAYRLNEQFNDLLAADAKLFVSERRAQTLVCHDFKGNYLTDKFVTGGVKFDDYRFYNWAACDIFCYFSHYFVTVPTLQWLNAAHKHGVKVLGTFIVESRAGHRRLNEEVLKSYETARSVADALVSICEQCKFEGWLVNIECTVDENNVQVLK